MGLWRVGNNKVSNAKSHFVHAVQRYIDSSQGHELIHHSFRLPSFSEAQELKAYSGDGLIAILRLGPDYHGVSVVPVEVPTHVCAICYSRTAVIIGLGRNFCLIESFRQEGDDIFCHFAVGATSTLSDIFIEAIVSLILHIVETIINFLYGSDSLDFISKEVPEP